MAKVVMLKDTYEPYVFSSNKFPLMRAFVNLSGAGNYYPDRFGMWHRSIARLMII